MVLVRRSRVISTLLIASKQRTMGISPHQEYALIFDRVQKRANPMIAVSRWYWCDKCETHAYPVDVDFTPAYPTVVGDDCARDVVVIYGCRCRKFWLFVKHVEDANGDLWPDYVPPSAGARP